VKQAADQVVNITNIHIHMPILIEMLKKASIKVQCNALETIEALTRRYASMCVASITKIASAIAPLIND